ncbi:MULTISPECIES: amidohydrolase family protein [unclassified Streptomyces]|uniref:amidohydrolase family protein n=1 Tax=unclassified Streptomyces TaxID=2593676 RepID=UPI001319068B|nr:MULTISPECIES: amidohydrolase family protein [unclassified Streptomyces]QHC31866.1 amidohydrolase family protein [Streptomyces sp. HF10]WKE69149.1 amidohydrolase family protein [Streptomyces sp. WP-1]
MAASRRIDVHQHLIPGAYREVMERHGATAAGWPTPAWDAESAIAMMDRRSIATGVLSVSSPGTHFGDDAEARAVTRSVNEYGAELVKDRPDRFGLFASLPLPDVDGALAEAAYALDELRADGVVLMSNAHGRYLGDKEFAPLWEELDARGAVVFIHPTGSALPMLDGLPGPVVDFPFDTTRTALHMAVNGVMSRHTRMKVILSHAGGFLPYAAWRFTAGAQFNPGTTPEGILADLRRFYFDTALSASPSALPSLLAFAAPGHVLYGSDWPFAAEEYGTVFDSMLDGYDGYEPGRLDAINRGSAEALFPRLRAA